jgi:hypothetical protein
MAVLKLSYVYRPGMELLAGAAFAATFFVGGLWLTTGTAPGPLTGTLLAAEDRYASLWNVQAGRAEFSSAKTD